MPSEKTAADCWGVAGSGLAFEFEGPEFGALIARRYKNFSGRTKVRNRPLYRFLVKNNVGRQAPFKPVILIEGGILHLKRGDFDCVVNLKTGSGLLVVAPRIQTFDSFLRTFYSYLLLREGGMLLHCAALLKNGGAYLFPGRSGAGKSTLSKLAAGAGLEVISDELNLLRFEKGRFRVYGSPFWGEMRNEGRQGVWPLEKIFIIKKAAKHRVENIKPGEALAVLLRCLMNFSGTRDAADSALVNAAELLSAVPVKRLEFSKRDAGFLALLKK